MAVKSKKIIKGAKAPSPKVTKPAKSAPTKTAPPTKKKPEPPKKSAPPVKTAPKQAAKPVVATKAPETTKAKPIASALPRMPRPASLTQMIGGMNGTNAPQIPAAVQAFLDKGEISEIIYRLARGLDRIDETLLRAVFHHEATLDLGPGVFQGTSNDYIHWVVGVMNQVRSSHHLIGNILVTLEGDAALVESYCHAHFRMDKPTGREDVFIGSRFLDRFERRPSGPSGVWKIMHRKQVIDWVRTEAVSDLFYHQNPDALWSYRTKTDPSYQMAQFPGSQPGSKLPSFLGRRYESKSVKF